MKKTVIFIIVSAMLVSCSYSVYTTGYPHLKTISVLPFENRTTEYQVEDELFNDLSNRFEQDGRLNIVTISPDCQLEGKILDYTDKIYSYNTEGIEEYQVKILFSVIFTDLKQNEIIYQNDTLVLKEEYSSDSDNVDFETEEAARNEIYKDLFNHILRETLEEW